MKYVMAMVVMSMVGACAGSRSDRPPPATASEPVGTTQTTSSALMLYEGEPVTMDTAPAPIVAVKESDRNLATNIRSHLGRDQSLATCPWQRVSMEVEDQHVTLRGHLPTLADSTELERAVRDVKGVRAVTNEIVVNEAHQLLQ